MRPFYIFFVCLFFFLFFFPPFIFFLNFGVFFSIYPLCFVNFGPVAPVGLLKKSNDATCTQKILPIVLLYAL